MTNGDCRSDHRHVAEARFLNGDIRRAFVRSGGSDVRCSDQERNGFLIDAAAERPDGQAVDLNPATASVSCAQRFRASRRRRLSGYVLTEAGAALKAARLGRPENERRGQP